MSCPSPEAVLCIGPLEIDPASGEVRRGGEVRRLQPQTLALLLALTESPGRVVTREELRRRLWPDTAVGFEDGLNHAVARLREALQDSAQAPSLIETIPRTGYRFVGTVERGRPEPVPGASAGSASLAPTAPASAPDAVRRSGRRRLAWAAAGLLAAMLAAAVFSRPSGRDHTAAGIRSIAVLPLANLSPDRTQDYFADGVTEELITELARCESLRVVSRTTTLHYRGSTKTVPEIAGELGVDAVVEGSVQRAGGRVRVAAQLVRGSPEEHFWAQSYDAPVDDVLALRSRVAEDIVRQVGQRLPRPSARPHKVSAAAYDAFLLGWNLALQATSEGYAKSIEYFERAIALDPGYAPAYAELAESHAMLDYLDDRRGAHFERARTLARRAVELAPDLAEARLREADLKFYWDWDWSQCEAGFRVARDLSPGSADTHEHYALCLVQLGRDDEALREFGRTLELEPLSVRSRRIHARLLSRAGRQGEAIEEFRKAADLSPADSRLLAQLGHALLDGSRGAEALEVFAAAGRLNGSPAAWPAALADAWRRGGPAALLAAVRADERRALQRRLADLEARARSEAVSPMALARVQAGLGNVDRAFEMLDQAFRERRPLLGGIKADSQLDPLRVDPRYRALLRRMKLPVD